MNYQIIADRNKFFSFLEWLPELENNETFYCSLMARRKYCPDLPSDRAQLKRFTCNRKELIFSKIKQLECEIGSYTAGNVVVPQEALAFYVTPNPRSQEKAAKNLLIKLANCITQPYDGYNIHQLALSELQKADGRKLYYDLDFDNLEISEFLNIVDKKINKDCLHFVKTRGGFHCLLEFAKMEKQYEKSWYKTLTAVRGCDVKGTDVLLPAVGCWQGNFIPYFY